MEQHDQQQEPVREREERDEPERHGDAMHVEVHASTDEEKAAVAGYNPWAE